MLSTFVAETMKMDRKTNISKHLSLGLVALMTVLSVQAEILSGEVLDENKEPMIGCNVYIENTYFGCSTDAEGHFEFEAELTDTSVLRIEFVGYVGFRQKVTELGPLNKIQVVMVEEFNKLKAVTVTAGRYGTGETTEVAVLSSVDVVTTAGALGNVIGALQTLPGNTTVDESGKLFVHGGSSRETGTYIDGIFVHQPYTSSAPNMGVRGRFNPFLFSGTAFSTGGYSAEYGQALSSILVLNTKQIPEEESVNLGIMSIGGDVAMTKKWSKGAITLSGSYMNLAPYMGFIPQNYQWNKAPETLSASLSLRQHTSGKGLFKLYASADGSALSQQQNLFGQENNVRTSVKNINRFINCSWNGMVGADWLLKTGFSFTYNRDELELGNESLTESLIGSHAKMVLKKQLREKLQLRLGTEYFYTQYSLKNGEQDSSLHSAQLVDHKAAGFSEIEYYLSKSLVFQLGLRAEYGSAVDQSVISPRFSMAHRFKDESQISLAYGRFFQAPDHRFHIMIPQLRMESATHYIVNYQKTMGMRKIYSEAYFKQYDELTLFEAENPNGGQGYAYGLDLHFRDKKSIRNGDYWISYSFLKTERHELDFPIMATPRFAAQHNFSFVYKHWFGDIRSFVGATLRYGSPRPHNNPNQTEFMADQLPVFKSLDMNWTYLHRNNIIFYASVTNVLGFENVNGYHYAPEPDANGYWDRSAQLPYAKRFYFIGCFITLSKKGTDNQLDQIN
jgi:hypothetical protein